MIKIHSNGCQKCEVIKKLLTQQNIPYEEVEPNYELLKEMGFDSLPVLQNGNEFYPFKDAAMMIVPCKDCKI